jgi:TPR repeat protein
MLRRFTSFFILVCVLVGPAQAGALADGVAALERGDYAAALTLLRPLAEEGDAAAQYHLGLMFYKGHGVPLDTVEGVGWIRSAAEQGLAIAQFVLGSRYYAGEGVPQDYAEAARWWRQAADQGLAGAQVLLGLSYRSGAGVKKDDGEAVRWFRRAADQNDAVAQYMLGIEYADGAKAVPQDDVLAFMWFNLAAAQGHPDAKDAVDQLARRMTPEQIAEAQRLVREWKPN